MITGCSEYQVKDIEATMRRHNITTARRLPDGWFDDNGRLAPATAGQMTRLADRFGYGRRCRYGASADIEWKLYP